MELTHKNSDFFRGDGPMQSIARKQQNVARQQLVLVSFGVHHHVGAERAAKEMPLLGFCSFFVGKQSHAHLLSHQSMVLSEWLGMAAAYEVTTRVADVGNGHTVEAQ